MRARPSRRRFISIIGAATGLTLVPSLSMGALHRVNWKGKALGGEASISIYHHDASTGEAVLAACAAEIIRLEKIFSLFRRDSALVKLNEAGQLTPPPPELVALLLRANEISKASGSAFDVTVQPLWALYARHFSRAGAHPDGPAPEAVQAARDLVGWQDLSVSEILISMAKPGMAVTLNGIAQGYITDRITDILRGHGIGDMFVDLGEFRAIGGHPDGRSWRLGISDPLNKSGLIDILELRNQAVASSGGYGTTLDADGRFHHLFDPKDGQPARFWAGVTVVAKSAATADALSTALAVTEPEQAQSLMRKVGGQAALLVSYDGTITRMESGNRIGGV